MFNCTHIYTLKDGTGPYGHTLPRTYTKYKQPGTPVVYESPRLHPLQWYLPGDYPSNVFLHRYVNSEPPVDPPSEGLYVPHRVRPVMNPFPCHHSYTHQTSFLDI